MGRSEALKKSWEQRRLTFVPPMKGKTMSEESRHKMSEAAKTRPSNRIGKKHTPESRQKISENTRKSAARGPSNPNWKDGKTVERRGIRFSAEYKRWRYDVFTRDGFTCQECGDSRGGNLVAHHIKSFADHPELRLDLLNGLTLCESCHKLKHGGKSDE